MEGSPEQRPKVEEIPVPSHHEPRVYMHHVLGEKVEAATKEEEIKIYEEILEYEKGLLTAVEQNPSLTLKAKANIAEKQKRIIQQAEKELEKAKEVESA